ncbi:MAG TPA: Ku protein [Planctomycetota bacterium]
MAPRTSWKGFLKLSLVSVPVKAYTANNTDEEIRLNQLHGECHGRVRYKKVCEAHGELKSEDIVSGYEYTKDQYVVIEEEELAKVRKQSDRSVAIDGFVAPDKIDPVYLAGKTYYLLPDGVAGNRPYALLVRGMVEANVVAVAQVVLSGREQLVMLRPQDGMLVMSVLNYPKKVRAATPYRDELPEEKPSASELALANTLIGASTLAEFDFQTYRDAYVENLTKLIQLKVEGREIVRAPDPEEPKILNLMEALKKSVAELGVRKMAPSVKGPEGEAAEAEAAPARKKRTRKTG